MPQPADRLSTYRAKRSADRTPEPFGGEGIAGAGLFVVQKHAARRLHYDLRLEHRGVLMSWAVPNGISRDPTDKRFAAQTEDHPIEYADFEGVIPEGEYGAGEMIVWDRGAVDFVEDPDAGLAAGKLVFDLVGYKLVGQWTLVRMKEASEWLLIKHSDAWSEADAPPYDERSVLSGRTIEDVASAATTRADAVRELTAGLPSTDLTAMSVDLMLANVAEGAFTDDDWLFEIKYDGYRMVAGKEGRAASLRYRSGLDATAIFPEIAAAVRKLPFDHLVLDGEVAVLDGSGRPSFSSLQRRGRLGNRHQIAVAGVRSPATYFAFDLLACDGVDLRSLPLTERKRALTSVVGDLGPLRYADHVVGRGEAMYEQVVAMGLEGLMAKRMDSPYGAGRSDAWLKVRAERTDTFAIVGFTAPKGGRAGFGALHLAFERDGTLTYAGRVGSGFTDGDIRALRTELDGHVASGPPVVVPKASGDTWVEPVLAARVRYREITPDDALRHPVFVSWGPLEHGAVLEVGGGGSEPPPPAIIDARSTEPTNTDKVFWPDDGYTKGDLIDYYESVADHLLPFLADRPLVLDRYPDGIEGKSFFQKNAPDFVPDWVRTEWLGREDETGNNYFIADDLETLRYVANLGSIPLHLWASRCGSIEAPDWCVLDLDPKEAPFAWVVQVAREIHAICEAMGIPSYPKTSGKTGLHILIPMGGRYGYDQQKLLAELIARVVESRLPDIATTARLPSQRGGKVYVDYLQNGRGKLLVAPYAVRPVPGATVSAPLRWSEVGPKLDVTRYTIKTMRGRLARQSSDPIAPVLADAPDILAGLRSLAAGMDG